jgi:peptidoglycan/LPS O-acetylase OafA/YrhL
VRHRFLLFLVSCFLGGLGGALGSIIGHAAGKTGLFVGGVVGGLLGAAASGAVASGRGWIPRSAAKRTSVGAAIGFLVAAFIATQTLGSPIGPIMSTSLIGLGALAGAGRHRDSHNQ